ncbi:MAG: hypothetical protein A3F26_02265 [Candidatus Ryanbacteria bacterium RIFCSPHIGHO2_12_FULL_47_12b]|uniref:Uncharacterized protein n=2 Tax=Candidatus Ryaniibacteriota TaxID=1817914 RepID=A0A1G2H1A4_9BACT|nr:MAG: hypothetical protein UX74_C0005G0011 [Parcubacteria group bacterium GW2011_GWA2_47_10b]OGZ44807.1 MAG: hypothetical protein A2844_01250 [Candidatus Ryanbacteria bacterium RIFCSPHIGHO2_01_FULL_48_80]OGZ48939.1 MAG: hypothetical protein A3C83_02885 [Candidatus Ryanbacteria bacterium RIFCSPHIGHO2_02_FULL_47_25]OGZ52489.1 MAG: hypothetical protein A3F26_02265 [Candidatus Ryanbacteria bacterium RIFCSPHIGHO2_12_FULL_47_12b]OGZ56244.1 MAG: hypothetical protein A3G60_01910 [Candidatus Ryanbacte
MARTRNREWEQNQINTNLVGFLENYNQNIPGGFPRASVKSLKEFQVAHPLLFKHGDEWSVDRHRKRLMDWLSSHRDDS